MPPGEDLVAATTRLGHALTDLVEGLQRHPDHVPAPGEHAPWYPAHLGGHAPDRAEALELDDVPRSAVHAELGSADTRAAAGVPGVGNHRVTTADWARVQRGVAHQVGHQGDRDDAARDQQGERGHDGQQVLDGDHGVGQPVGQGVGRDDVSLGDVAESGRKHREPSHHGQVGGTEAEVAAVGERDAEQGGRAQRGDQFRGHRPDRHARRHLGQQV